MTPVRLDEVFPADACVYNEKQCERKVRTARILRSSNAQCCGFVPWRRVNKKFQACAGESVAWRDSYCTRSRMRFGLIGVATGA
jgi:hypothetical protein